MEIKDKFNLLKDVPNTFKISSAKLNSYSIPQGPAKIYNTLKLSEDRINHFTKNKVFSTINEIKINKKVISLVYMENYILPVSYNYTTNTIIINLRQFATDDISRVDPRNIYACVTYGICFRDLITKKIKVPDTLFSVVSAFMTTILMRLFGKEFGLLGTYATQIPILKFLTNCYIIATMFGETNKVSLYKKAGASSGVDFRPYLDKLGQYDLSNINDYIKSLSDFKIMPGITRHTFAARILKTLTINFLPGLEDLSRFISVVTTADLPGNSISPAFISKYNKSEFDKILSISKNIFK